MSIAAMFESVKRYGYVTDAKEYASNFLALRFFITRSAKSLFLFFTEISPDIFSANECIASLLRNILIQSGGKINWP